MSLRDCQNNIIKNKIWNIEGVSTNAPVHSIRRNRIIGNTNTPLSSVLLIETRCIKQEATLCLSWIGRILVKRTPKTKKSRCFPGWCGYCMDAQVGRSAHVNLPCLPLFKHCQALGSRLTLALC